MKLNLRWGLLALVLCCLTLNDICAAQNGLVVTGDVARELVLSGYEGLETVSIEYRGAAQEVIPCCPFWSRREYWGGRAYSAHRL